MKTISNIVLLVGYALGIILLACIAAVFIAALLVAVPVFAAWKVTRLVNELVLVMNRR